MSELGVQRHLRLNLGLFKLNGGYESFSYGSAGKATDVPPHPEDKGAETRPVDPGSKNTFEFTVGADVTVDLYQWFYLKYQIQWDATTERENINHDDYGCKPHSSYIGPEQSCTGKEVPNTKPYASGGNNETFVYANEGAPSVMHSLSVGYYPILVQSDLVSGYRERSLALEAGLATKNYSLTRGWVRDGIVEVKDEKAIDLLGATWGIYYQNLTIKEDGGKTMQGGIRFGIKGSHFLGNSHIFTAEIAVPVGIGF
jgi:hypothetical protein